MLRMGQPKRASGACSAEVAPGTAAVNRGRRPTTVEQPVPIGSIDELPRQLREISTTLWRVAWTDASPARTSRARAGTQLSRQASLARARILATEI